MNFLIVQRLEHLTLTQKIVVQIHVRKPVFLGSSVGMNGWLLTTMSQVRVLPEEPCTESGVLQWAVPGSTCYLTRGGKQVTGWKAYTLQRDP